MDKKELKYLFSTGTIGNIQIKNRIVRSATICGLAEKGYVSEQQIKLYADLAQGGTGLIITGGTAVDITGLLAGNQAYLYDDTFISGQKKIVKAVHEYSDVKIACQLIHAGRQCTHPKYPPIAPSAIPNNFTKLTPHELTPEEIRSLTKKFVDAGRRAYEGGYDMIQMHAAHDYLLNNFLSPYTNRRNDEFGGNTEKRTKILVDIRDQLRDEVGKEFPVMVKLQTIDGFPYGIDLKEAIKIAQILVDASYDAIEPSGGSGETMFAGKKITPSPTIKKPEDENYFLANAKTLKTIENCCPLILVGGIRNPLIAEKILQEKCADFISMSRPLIREPNLPNRWKIGDLKPAHCISCNACLGTLFIGCVHCVPKKRLERRRKREAKKN